jgi:hypothetical protein
LAAERKAKKAEEAAAARAVAMAAAANKWVQKQNKVREVHILRIYIYNTLSSLCGIIWYFVVCSQVQKFLNWFFRLL